MGQITPFYLNRLEYLLKNEKVMKVNVKHPTFQSYLEDVTTNILSLISIENYFKLNNDAKIGIQFIVLKYIDSSLKIRLSIEEEDIKKFIHYLLIRSDENENYEFSGILKDLNSNFDLLISKTKTKEVRKSRRIKKEITD
jgi:hypothetical protein